MFDPKTHCERIEQGWWEAGHGDAAALQALYESDLPAFWAREAAAWDHFDIAGIIAAGEALRRAGALDAGQGMKLARALLAVDRAEEALAVLDAADEPLGAKHHFHRGRALVSLGRATEAVEAFDAALAARGNFGGAEEWRRRTVEFRALSEALRAAPGWSLASQTVRAADALRMRSADGELLQALADNGATPTAEEAEAVAAVLDRAIAVLSSEATTRLLEHASGRAEAEAEAATAKLALRLKRPLASFTRPDSFEARYWSALAMGAEGDPAAAFIQMDALAKDQPDDTRARLALAYLSGGAVRSLASSATTQGTATRAAHAPRTWNIFPFNNEFLMLRMRLQEMDWIDEFVLVEARQTFTGAAKPLHFARRKAEFADVAHKLRHVVVDRFPHGVETAWARDYYQRDYGALPLYESADPNDLVFVTDVDELVSAETVQGFRGDFARLEMNTFRFFLNYRPTRDNTRERMGRTGVVCRAGEIQAHGASYLRFFVARVRKEWPVIAGGWHFTGVGDATTVAGKFRDYAHQEARYDHFRDPQAVERILVEIRAGANGAAWEKEHDLSQLPRFVRDNAEALRDLLL